MDEKLYDTCTHLIDAIIALADEMASLKDALEDMTLAVEGLHDPLSDVAKSLAGFFHTRNTPH
jgi:hypothetical protein